MVARQGWTQEFTKMWPCWPNTNKRRKESCFYFKKNMSSGPWGWGRSGWCCRAGRRVLLQVLGPARVCPGGTPNNSVLRWHHMVPKQREKLVAVAFSCGTATSMLVMIYKACCKHATSTYLPLAAAWAAAWAAAREGHPKFSTWS